MKKPKARSVLVKARLASYAAVMKALSPLSKSERRRVLGAAAIFLGVGEFDPPLAPRRRKR